MKIIGIFALVENVNELKKNIVWEDNENIGVRAIGTFHDINKVVYPCAFKCTFSPYDSHCCADWVPCSKHEMAQFVKIEIMRLSSKIERFNRVLDTLKEEESE